MIYWVITPCLLFCVTGRLVVGVRIEPLGKGTAAETEFKLASGRSEKLISHGKVFVDLEPTALRILVVDDSVTNLKLLMRMLSTRGHICDGACDGQEAISMVKDSIDLYDTILLDYEMPRIDGPTACTRMRKMGCSSYIVGITGNLLPEDVMHFKISGADSVLPKPINISLLEDLWSEYNLSGRVPRPSVQKEPPVENGAMQKISKESDFLNDEPDC